MNPGGSRLVVRFSHERTPHTVQVLSDREAQDTLAGWRRDGGLWAISDGGVRAWVPWHSVAEVALPDPPGQNPAVIPFKTRVAA